MKPLLLLVLACAYGFASAQGRDQDYPTKPVTLLVGFAAGGATEIAARIIAARLSQKWNRPVVVDIRAGGNGAIAANALKASAPDGYTLMLGTSSQLIVTPFVESVGFDTNKDILPIGFISSMYYILNVNLELPVTDVRSFVEYAKANPGKLTYGSSGATSLGYLGTELFNSLAGIDMVHAPYRGDAAYVPDLIAGRLQVAFSTSIVALPQVKGGKVRPLAVTSLKRARLASTIPTMAEVGFPGFELIAWNGLVGRSGMSSDLVTRINKALNEVLRDPDVVRRIEEQGLEVAAGAPEEFHQFLNREIVRWRDVIQRVKGKGK